MTVRRTASLLFLAFLAAAPARSQQSDAAAFGKARDAFKAAVRKLKFEELAQPMFVPPRTQLQNGVSVDRDAQRKADEAEAAFEVALKATLAEFSKATSELAAFADPKAMEEFFVALRATEVQVAKARAQAETVGKELRKAWKVIDEQSAENRLPTVNAAQLAQNKAVEIETELLRVDGRLRGLEAAADMCRQGAARSLDAMPPARRAPEALKVGEAVLKSGDVDDRVSLVRVLAASRAPETKTALVEVLARAQAAAVRTAAADGLRALADPSAAPALVKALSDEAWNVKAAAARALASTPSLEPVPALIDLLGKVDGRALDELIECLEDLTGVSFFENASLWKEWWAKEGESLSKTLADMDASEPAARMAAYAAAVEKPSGAAARKLALAEGLAPDRDASAPVALGAKPPPIAAADEEAMTRRLALGKIVSTRPKPVRDRLVARLLDEPAQALRAGGEWAREARYRAATGGIRTPEVRKLLEFAVVQKEPPPETPDHDRRGPPPKKKELPREALEALQVGAAEGLGYQGDDGAAALIGKVLTDPDTPKTEAAKLAAVRGLEALRRKSAVRPLLAALGDGGAVAKAAQDALTRLTGKEFAADAAKWRDWWKNEGAAQPGLLEGDPLPVASGAPGTEPGARRGGTSFYGITTRSKRLLYILDVSGSMNENDAAGKKKRIDVAKEELVNSIRSLPDDATFNIVFYNHEHSAWKTKPVKADKAGKAEAIKWAEAVTAVGATNIFDALELGFQLAGRGTQDKRYQVVVDTVFFMSDGQPNRGRLVEPAQILAEVLRMNSEQKLKIHAVGVGKDHAVDFMKSLAERTGGTYVAR
ncbi:MAG TPA: HEAT repeat domain-containing protein [Planctomycetota bacterium]|nr:HEAT repeat domain-containing protein [Planctomycetota bacterium]